LAARNGSQDALNWLLEKCRPYLLMIANEELESDLRPKVAPSDLVQESVLEAWHDFADFRGGTGKELFAWLRCILRHNLADARRHYRDATARQIRNEQLLDASNATALREKLTSGDTSPPDRVVAQEQAETLEQTLSRLPEEYRRVLLLRHQEDRPFAEIGAALGRSEGAAKKLWRRAVRRLRQEMRGEHDSG
jgi:RNA polymerase sigma-70 factor (ECF subfamily)